MEAYILKKPCITLRTETERVETVASGWNLLLSPTDGDIAEKIKGFSPSGAHPNVFGDNVAKKMAKIIKEWAEQS